MTTNETSIFRDVAAFDCLRDMALPELIERRAAERRLNIWSSACSSGQEAYSIALLLAEHFPLLASWRTRILASDLNTDMLERTRVGRYSQLEINRGLPVRYLVNYFDRQDSDWRVKQSLRDRVEVQRINLIEDWQGLPPMDIVMLRNVLIYFDIATKKTVLARIRELLRPDGYLFLGGAETTLNLDDAFERVDAARAGCERVSESPPTRPIWQPYANRPPIAGGNAKRNLQGLASRRHRLRFTAGRPRRRIQGSARRPTVDGIDFCLPGFTHFAHHGWRASLTFGLKCSILRRTAA